MRQLGRDGVAGDKCQRSRLVEQQSSVLLQGRGDGTAPRNHIELAAVVGVTHEDHVQQTALVSGEHVINDLAAVLCRIV